MEVTMPQMGVSVAEGTIVEWRKQPGDSVAADEPIVEISTDKVETEVPAPAAGRLREVLVEAGETVDVGTVLATIETAAVADEAAEPRAPAETSDEERPPPSGDGHVPERGDGGSPPVTPVVRRMAEEHHLDVSRIE